MCGIVGIIDFSGRNVEQEQLLAMRDTLVHRGPDDAGIYLSKNVGLGHRRLSIIDLSEMGRQPLSNEDRTIWVTFNGEIYNFSEIRQELEACGHTFRSNTDTEVIVHAYEEWGLDSVHKYNGMFAFCIWDERKKRLWLVRDRLGVKPLFYSRTNNVFAFASEIKGVLAADRVDRGVDHTALAYYLGLNWTPAPHTLFESVKQVLPGHSLVVEADGSMRDHEYWTLDADETRSRSEGEWIEELDSLMNDATGKRLTCDVPFGLFLSGGLDSSAVAWWMKQNLSSPTRSFSIAFNEATYDESAYAREVADSLGTIHTDRVLEPNAVDIFSKLVWHCEEPTADSSSLAVYHLAKETRRNVTMVLTGDGADELFAGYETYTAFYLAKLYRFFPGPLRRKVIDPMLKALPISYKKYSLQEKLKRFVYAASKPNEQPHALWRVICDENMRKDLLAPIWSDPKAQSDVANLFQDYFTACPLKKTLNRLLWVDSRLYLPNDMLVKVDRMTMAHSLEARSPFLDYRVAELASAIPPSLKLKYFVQKKYILKQIMKSRLPHSVLYRKKSGFNIPVGLWLNTMLKEFVADTLSVSNLNDIDYIDTGAARALLDDHLAGRKDYGHQLWGLLTLVVWHQTFVKGMQQ